MDVHVEKASSLRGTITVPGDKSISHRALLIGSLAQGKTEIEGLSSAADPNSTLDCIRNLGIEVQQGRKTIVHGKGIRGYLKPPRALECGNSGTTMRLLLGILAGQNFPSELIGDDSLSRRPMERVITPLTKMGARIKSSQQKTAPLSIDGTGRLNPIEYELPVASAQVKSAVLLAGLFAEGTTRIIEKQPSRDHTERMLGLQTEGIEGARVTSIIGGRRIEPQSFIIPGDISSAAYFIAAGIVVPGSDVVIQNVGLNPTRIAFVQVLTNLGAQIEVEHKRETGGEPIGDLRVKASELHGEMKLSGDMIPQVIDEIPILAMTSVLSGIPFQLRNAEELRKKESDRIHAMITNLRTIGVEVEEYQDGFEFGGTRSLRGGSIDSYRDHRIAMTFGVAGLRIPGMVIRDAECVEISFPGFWEEIRTVSR